MKIPIFLVLFSTQLFSQVQRQWISTYNGIASSEVRGFKVDNLGNTIIAGVSSDSISHIITFKYNTSGQLVWSRTYSNGGISTGARAMTTDKYGNIYVTCDDAIGQTYLTLKYNSGGVLKWSSAHIFTNAPCLPTSIAVDSTGSVYVNGRVNPIYNLDIATLKYDSNGVEQWLRTFNGNSDSIDIPCSVACGLDGNIYVTGTSYNGTFLDDFVIIKYNASGQQIMVKYIDFNNGDENAISTCLDNLNNIYITGSSFGNYATVKCNSQGLIIWQNTYGSEYSNTANAICTDKYYNVYVTGTSKDSGINNFNIATIKYNSSGVQQWASRYSGPGASYDAGNSIACDSNSNIYVGGYITVSEFNRDYITLKYSSSGQQNWLQTFNGQGNSIDQIYFIDCNNSGDVYVSGNSNRNTSNEDIVTIKYSQPIGIQTISTVIPKSFSLSQNYPNPFNPSTKIKFDIPLLSQGGVSRRDGVVSLTIYDVLGREVTTLVNEQLQPGTYSVEWNASNFASGIYFYTFKTESFNQSKRMVLIK